MHKLVSYMVAWIPSRWLDEHKTVLYKRREPLSIQAASIWLRSYNTALPERDRVQERVTQRERERALFELQNLINIKIIKQLSITPALGLSSCGCPWGTKDLWLSYLRGLLSGRSTTDQLAAEPLQRLQCLPREIRDDIDASSQEFCEGYLEPRLRNSWRRV